MGTAAVARPAAGDQGVRLDLGSVRVEAPLAPGQSYALPVLGVSNPGDVRTTYRMASTSISASSKLRIDPGWLAYDPPIFTLDPGATQAVRLHVAIPPGAAAGEYEGLVQAQISTPATGQVGVTGGAAMRLTFTVKAATLAEGWSTVIGGWLATLSPWWQLVIVLLALALIGRRLRRRYRFTFGVERRDPPPE